MIRLLKNYLRRQVKPRLKARSQTGTLSKQEHEIIYQLFEILTDDVTCDPAWVAAHVNDLTERTPGYYREFIAGIKLLNRKSTTRHFFEQKMEEQHLAVKSILRPYPHMENNPWMRQITKLTSENMNAFIVPSGSVRFRQFIVRPLLGLYYRGAHGWSLVGYDKFPGMMASDQQPGVVTGIVQDHGRYLLKLDDETIEPLTSEQIVFEKGSISHVKIKGGLQIATLSPSLTVFEHNALREIAQRGSGVSA